MVQLPTPVGRVGIYQSDAQGQCVYVNTALCELFGLSAKEAMGLGWMDRIHPDDRQRVLAARQTAVSPIPMFYLDYRIVVGGKTLWIAAFSTALMESGIFRGRIGTITDITEAKMHLRDEDSGSG
jgi:PAS domain S-box-containing protein